MPVPVSSLSVAIQGIADFLDSQFGEDVVISVAHPQKAAEQAKGGGTNAAHYLNLFAYRIAPSGFHVDAGADQTQFVRINALITPFPADLDNAADDADLRILGHAIRVLQSHPVLPITAPLPGAALTEPDGRKSYRLQAIMQAPPMEELNHIWTTQGGELAYRLSAAYEFALIPIEPLEPREPVEPPRTLMIDTGIDMSRAELDFNPPGENSRSIPLGDGAAPPPTNWLPVQMFVDGGMLTNALAVSAGTTEATIALAGPQAESAALDVIWTLGDDSESAQAPQILPIQSAMLDAPAAQATLVLAIPGNAVSAVVRSRPAAGGAPVADSPFGNTLTLTVN